MQKKCFEGLLIFFIIVLFNDLHASSYTEEATHIINAIQSEQPPKNIIWTVRSGLIQLDSNTVDPIELNSNNIMPYIETKGQFYLWDTYSLEARFNLAQNLMSTGSGANSSGANEWLFEVGMRYDWILDLSRQENYFGFRLFYHQTQNNFELSDSTEYVFVKKYTGFGMGIERSLFITKKLTLVASLQAIYLMGAETDSIFKVDSSGLAYQVFGELRYRNDWFGRQGHVGAQFAQDNFTNGFDDDGKNQFFRNSHVQLHRTLSLSYTMMY